MTSRAARIRSPGVIERLQRMSFALAVLAALAAAWGVFVPDLYRDNAWAASQFRGNDVVTLFVAVPLFVVAIDFARRGSVRGLLAWIAGLHFMIYNYAFYLFGAAFNEMFLVYVAVVALALFAMVGVLSTLDFREIGRAFDAATPRVVPGVFLLLVGVVLGGIWIAQSFGFLATGVLPASVPASGHPTAVVFAVDLVLLVPYFLLAGIWLLRRNPLGTSVGAVMSISGAVYTLALAGMAVFADRGVVEGALALLPMWLSLSGLSAVVAWMVLRQAPAMRGSTR